MTRDLKRKMLPAEAKWMNKSSAQASAQRFLREYKK
jgi:hypothetical protein